MKLWPWGRGHLKEIDRDIADLKSGIEAAERSLAEAISLTDQSFIEVETKTLKLKEAIAEEGFDPDDYTPSPVMRSVKRLK